MRFIMMGMVSLYPVNLLSAMLNYQTYFLLIFTDIG